MMALLPMLVLAGIFSGPLLAELGSRRMKRCLGWLLILALVVCADLVTRHIAPFARMVALCSVLFAGMKSLVYAEWAGKQKLPWSRYAIYSFLWFGMDPGAFVIRRPRLAWKQDLLVGTILMAAGLLGCWFVRFMEWRHVLVLFIPLSLGFHFGLLRILKALLRAAGFPVRTLFPNLLKARGIADFWGHRWNVGYSQMMQRIVGRPVEDSHGPSAALLAIFIVSGLLHEIAITLPVGQDFGFPTLYFTLHGLLTLAEKKLNRPIGKAFTLLAVAAPLGWLFPPLFQKEVVVPSIAVVAGLFAW
jgi:alginate O-acetyltransferase complex protein AlgI